jgi:hypothetical protein
MTNLFPNWARIGLGLVVAFLGYLSGAEIIADEGIRSAIATGLVLFAAAGIVPPRASDLHMSKAVATALTVIAMTITAIINLPSVVGHIDGTVRGLIVALLATAAVVGIRPPQVATPTA